MRTSWAGIGIKPNAVSQGESILTSRRISFQKWCSGTNLDDERFHARDLIITAF